MGNSQLSNYIRQEIQKGSTPEKLRRELVDAGWSANEVREAVAPYADQRVSVKADAPSGGIKDTEIRMSAGQGDAGFVMPRESQSTGAIFTIGNISDSGSTPRATKTGSQKFLGSESPKEGARKFSSSGTIAAVVLIIIIAGSGYFLVRTFSSVLGTGTATTLTRPSTGETAVQRIKKQGQQTSGSGTRAGVPVSNPAAGAEPNTGGGGSNTTAIGNHLPDASTPEPGFTGTPIVEPNVVAPYATPTPISETPIGSTPIGNTDTPTPIGTPLTTPPSVEPVANNQTPATPIGTPYTPPPQPQATSSKMTAATSTGSTPAQLLPHASSTPSIAKPSLPAPIFPITQFGASSSLQVVSLTVSKITDTTAAIDWSVNHISFIKLEYGTSTSYGSLAPIASLPALFGTIVLQNLSPLTAYHYRIKVIDGTGTSIFSKDATFSTKPAQAIPAKNATTTPRTTKPASGSTNPSFNDQLNTLRDKLQKLLDALAG